MKLRNGIFKLSLQQSRMCAWLVGAMALLITPAAFAANILGSQVAGTGLFPATARLIVDTPVPSTYSGNLNQPFVFNGLNTYEFNVTGMIEIRQGNPVNSFTDPLTSVNYNAPGGLKALQQEIVNLSGASFVNPPGATVISMSLGDGVNDGADTGAQGGDLRSYFSTGGAVENLADGSTANAFLNLFLDVNLTAPTITTGALVAFGFDASYPIGQIFNAFDPLHVEAAISAYHPFNVPFLMPGGTVSMYLPANHDFVIDLNTIGGRPLAPLEAARFVFADIRIVPEPSSAIMAAIGASFIALVRRRKA
jgi:hypothetical protein